MKGIVIAVKKANPVTTRTGKPRLGPLNVKQLEVLLEKRNKRKTKQRFQKKLLGN
jgi:hypothetical protein